MLGEILGGLPGAGAGARLRQHQREIRRVEQRARRLGLGRARLCRRGACARRSPARRPRRSRPRPCSCSSSEPRSWGSGSLASAIVGGRSGMALKVQTTSSPPPLTVAVPAAVMVKCRSSVPLGACGFASASASAMPPLTAMSSPDWPVARTTRVEPAGTVTGPLARACDCSPGRSPGKISGGRPV